MGIPMIADASWYNKDFEGKVKKGRPFEARDERRAKELELKGLAHRADAAAVRLAARARVPVATSPGDTRVRPLRERTGEVVASSSLSPAVQRRAKAKRKSSTSVKLASGRRKKSA